MAENTKIAWTDHSWNPWIGCTKVSAGCDHCYAAAMDHRFGGGHWGAGAPRKRTSAANWAKVRKWNRDADTAGVRPWVFVASLADVFDNEVPDAWREELWALIGECRNLNFQIVTKRIGNAAKMLPDSWEKSFGHVGIIATVVTQNECDRDLPKLSALKCQHGIAWVGLSIEPQIEAVIPKEPVNWVITGGESDQSGAHGRQYKLAWAHDLIAWGKQTATPIFVKQLGSSAARALGLRDRAGADPSEWHDDIRVREMPPSPPTPAQGGGE